MYSAVSGLRVHQTKMDVIANNIANVNTVGFKSSRATFAEVFSQTISGASASNPITGRGGVNPRQIGLGATVASIDLLITQGAAQRTDNPFDIMISGDGFFIVGDSSGTYFTRAGAMNLDKAGNLVITNGMHVRGWTAVDDPLNPGEQIIDKGAVSDIVIGPDKQYAQPTATKNVSFAGNLNYTEDTTIKRTMSFYDSIGTRYVVGCTFEFDDASGGWTYTLDDFAYPNGDTDNPIDLTLSANSTGTITFNEDALPTGPLIDPADPNSAGIVIDIALPADKQPASTLGDNGRITIDFSDLTQFDNETSTVKGEMLDGNGPGTLNGIAVGSDGKIVGRYSNGDTKILAQIAVARFQNAAGLQKMGNNLFVTTANSGDFDGIGEEVQAGGGEMQGGVLEMSNVDLSAEFTEMITTQRGFQANSRVITTSDDMLQELVNLKR
jgi:flagellar hook protein FlgE